MARYLISHGARRVTIAMCCDDSLKMQNWTLEYWTMTDGVPDLQLSNRKTAACWGQQQQQWPNRRRRHRTTSARAGICSGRWSSRPRPTSTAVKFVLWPRVKVSQASTRVASTGSLPLVQIAPFAIRLFVCSYRRICLRQTYTYCWRTNYKLLLSYECNYLLFCDFVVCRCVVHYRCESKSSLLKLCAIFSFRLKIFPSVLADL